MSIGKYSGTRTWWRTTTGSGSAGRRLELNAERLEDRLVPANPVSGNAMFVEQVYRDMLGRDLDPTGLAKWVGALNAGTSKTSVVASILTSNESETDIVRNLFTQFLHRAADPAGLTAYTNELTSGASPEAVAAQLVGSAEYSSEPGNATDAGFLASLFQDGLNRPIDPTGQSILSAQLAAGVSRSTVAAEVLTSLEAREDFVETLYLNLLGRASDPTGKAAFVTQLQAGATDAQVAAGFLTSVEYTGVASAAGFAPGTFFLQDTGVEKAEIGDVGRTFTQIDSALGGNSPAATLAADFQTVAADVAAVQQLFAPLLTSGGAAVDLGNDDGQEILFNSQSFNQADKSVVFGIDPNGPDDDLAFLNSIGANVLANFAPQKVLGDAKAAINSAVSQVANIPVVGDIASAFNKYASALLTVMSAEGEIGSNILTGKGILPTDTLTPLVTAQIQQVIGAGVDKLVDKLEEPLNLSDTAKAAREKLIALLDDTLQATADMDPSNPDSPYQQLMQQQGEIDQNLPNTPAVPDPDANIQVTPQAVEAEVTEGNPNPAPVAIQIGNDGASGSQLQPTVSVDDSGVASVSQTEPPAVGADASDSVAVDLNTQGAPVGTEYGTAVVSDPDSDEGMLLVPIVITVNPATPATPAPTTPTPTTPASPSSAVTGIAVTNISVQGNTVVTAAVTPAISGVSVNYSVSGTDGFTTSGTVQTDANGNVSFNFASGATGVTDTITVQAPNGLSATKTYTY